ncbi:MAG: zinc ribbon domain-containing protein [Candidatus Hermodarchaeota archaeon]
MKYVKNQYSEGVSICTLIIAGMFLYWGLNDLLIRPFMEGAAVVWWGWIWIGIGASILVGQIAAWRNRSNLRNAVLYEYEAHPNATIEEISKNTGISLKDVQTIVLDLKASGLLRGKFSSSTGEMKDVEVIRTAEISTEKDTGVKYCPTCGTAKSKESAVFCSYCGTKF